MENMEKFLGDYPAATRVILGSMSIALIWAIGMYGKEVIENNTKALNKLTSVLETVVERVNGHDVTLAEHEIRLDRLDDK